MCVLLLYFFRLYNKPFTMAEKRKSVGNPGKSPSRKTSRTANKRYSVEDVLICGWDEDKKETEFKNHVDTLQWPESYRNLLISTHKKYLGALRAVDEDISTGSGPDRTRELLEQVTTTRDQVERDVEIILNSYGRRKSCTSSTTSR